MNARRPVLLRKAGLRIEAQGVMVTVTGVEVNTGVVELMKAKCSVIGPASGGSGGTTSCAVAVPVGLSAPLKFANVGVLTLPSAA